MHLSELAAQAPEKAAVVTADGRVRVTFAELDARSRQVSRLLAGLGVGPGDHVAVLMANRPEYFEIGWGCQRRGTYWTPVNWHLNADEAGYIVRDCGATVLFASPETAQLAAQIAAQVPGLTTFAVGGDGAGLLSYHDAIAGLSAGPLPDEVEGMYFYYSSGTTGRPKGILRSWTFPPFGAGVGLEPLLAGVFGFGSDTVYLCPAPLYHAAPLGFSMGTLRLGGTVVLMERFDPVECLRAIERHKVTAVQFVPTHFVRLLKLPQEQRRAFDISSLQTIVHAAAPCPVDVKRQMIEWLGPILWEYYAGSEGNGMTVIDSPGWLARPGTVGRALAASVHIVAEDGSELPPGEDGIIYFDGAPFEYHNDPVKTASSRHERGWSTLGDVGHLDADGYLYLSDRRTDLIISGGVNIYPAEIEQALIMHPAVADVAVIGVPDAEMGQSVLAVVQLSHAVTGSPQLAADLIEHCRSQLASFKCPRSVEFVAQLPRTPTGKLQRRKLRDPRAG
ncbi:MAG TPA: acyl-CoA synthetase [Streptosporangiaceae bacterium]|nr:acyl-CoA synthetase [Streptosporangiaceae bacterium]